MLKILTYFSNIADRRLFHYLRKWSFHCMKALLCASYAVESSPVDIDEPTSVCRSVRETYRKLEKLK